MVLRKSVWMLVGLGGLLACSNEGAKVDEVAYEKGQTLYKNICIVCHNADPSQPGILGPPITNASLELLTAKILRGEYPAGHTPAADTKQMPPMQYLEPSLPDLAVFLAGPRG